MNLAEGRRNTSILMAIQDLSNAYELLSKLFAGLPAPSPFFNPIGPTTVADIAAARKHINAAISRLKTDAMTATDDDGNQKSHRRADNKMDSHAHNLEGRPEQNRPQPQKRYSILLTLLEGPEIQPSPVTDDQSSIILEQRRINFDEDRPARNAFGVMKMFMDDEVQS